MADPQVVSHDPYSTMSALAAPAPTQEDPAASAPAPDVEPTTPEPSAPAAAVADDATEPDDEAEAEAEESTPPRQELSPGLQKKINRLTRQRREAERRELRLETELIELRAKLDTLTQIQGQHPAPASPQPPQEPREEDFDSHTAYVRALVRWEAEQIADSKLAAAEQARQLTAEQQAHRTQQAQQDDQWQQSLAAAQARHDDWEEVVSAVDDVPISQALVDAVRESELGGEVYYHLASHPAEITRLSKLQGAALYRALGRLEVSLSPADPAPTPSSDAPEADARPRVLARSRPPIPIRPVGGHAATTVPVARDTLSMKDYEAKRREEGYRGYWERG